MRSADLFHLAVVHYGNTVCNAYRFAQVVRCVYKGYIGLSMQLLQKRQYAIVVY